MTKIIPFLTLTWILVTFLTGRGGIQLSHPGWVSVSIIPVILLQLLWIQKSGTKEDKDIIPLSYGVVIVLLIASLLGIGVMMGVFPSSFHQAIVWLVGPYVVWIGFKQLSFH